MSALEARPLRYAATCVGCGAELQPKMRAVWDKERREATCEQCVAQAASPDTSQEHRANPQEESIDRGVPGASAMREGVRRQERRETQTIKAHPRIGKLILALSEEPQSTRAWKQGAIGEQALGGALETLRAEGLGVLHDRRVPGTRANIDHLVVGPAGVFVVDAKRYSGRIERRDRGWFLDRDWRLYVNGRDKTKLAQAMPAQREVVRHALVGSRFQDAAVVPVLCFVDGEWSLLTPSFEIGEVRIMRPRELYKLIRSAGPLTRDDIAELEGLLAGALPRS